MKQIRRNTFETNSSSCHSIGVYNKDTLYEHKLEEFNIPKNNEGKIEFKTGKFGWGFDLLEGQENKIKYLMTLLLGYYEPTEEEIRKTSDFELFEEYLSPYCNGIYFPEDDNDWKEGYIDHQSSDRIVHFLSEIGFERYLLDPKIVVAIENDNNSSPYYGKIEGLEELNPDDYGWVD